MSKIIAIADIHLDFSRRFKDTLNVMKQILDFAIYKKANYLMILGDIYQYKRPKNIERHAFETWVLRFVENKIKVVMIPGLKGKHDYDKRVSVLDEFGTLNITGVQVLDNGDIFITRDGVKIRMLHTLVQGAKLGALGYRPSSAENLSIQAILAMNKGISDIVTLIGHIHKAQVLHKDPLIAYVGSIDRIDFAERNEHKYLLYLDTEKKDDITNIIHKFYRLKTRPMIQFDIKTVKELQDIDTAKVKGVITKIIFHCLKADKNKFDQQLIDEKFSGAYSYSVHYDFIKSARLRNKEINERVTPAQAFIQYGKEKNLGQEVVKCGLKIIEDR